MNLDIYEDAERLAKRYGTRDPFELLDAMNVVVKFTDKFPKDGLKGFCTFMNKTKYVVINDRLSSIEARVVAGHEAGHIIRHATELKVGAFQDNDIYMATGKKEREANVFAADFLIRDADVLEGVFQFLAASEVKQPGSKAHRQPQTFASVVLLRAFVTTSAVTVESLPPEKEITIFSSLNLSAAFRTNEKASSFR